MDDKVERMAKAAAEAIHDYDVWQRSLAALRYDKIEPGPTFWGFYRGAVERVHDSALGLAQVLPK